MRLKMLRFAFLQAVPIIISYLFLGTAAGVLLAGEGYAPYWSAFAALLIYGGSMQIAMVPFLSTGMPLWLIAVMTFLINGRYLFYGLTFVNKYRTMGWRFPYMVYSTTDETYSLQISLKCPEDINENNARFAIQVICHLAWITGCTVGALLGRALPFDLKGIEFTATALFVAIAVDQWSGLKSHSPAVIGIATGILFFILLGPDGFILPALSMSLLLLVLFRHPIRDRLGDNGNE